MIDVLPNIQPPSILKLLAHKVRWQILLALMCSDYRVQELVHLVAQPANLVSYHLKQLRQQQLVMERRSSADARDVYYSVDLETLRTQYLAAADALHPALAIGEPAPDEAATQTDPPVRVLFVCTHNSARSQMAEGILRRLGGKRVDVYSAGSDPSSVHPDAMQVLARIGIDISGQRAKHCDLFLGQAFDYIITVCDRVRETCPVFPDDPQRIHWSFPDPASIEDADARYRAFEEIARHLTIRLHHLLLLIERKRKGQL